MPINNFVEPDIPESPKPSSQQLKSKSSRKLGREDSKEKSQKSQEIILGSDIQLSEGKLQKVKEYGNYLTNKRKVGDKKEKPDNDNQENAENSPSPTHLSNPPPTSLSQTHLYSQKRLKDSIDAFFITRQTYTS